MTAYIVGMIAGATCMVAPLLYLVQVSACMASLASDAEALDRFLERAPTGLVAPVVIIGAVVFLLSAGMAAWTGMVRLRASQPKAAAPEATEEPETPLM